MAKSSPGHRQKGQRLRQVAQASLACFMAAGYRLTQVAHVSERLGVSVGLVYRYVESKEALFHIAALEAVGRLSEDLSLPVRVAGVEETVSMLREAAPQGRDWPLLTAARTARRPKDVRTEASEIAAELYDAVSRRYQLIWLLDRCAHDLPQLAEIFDERIRNRYMDDLEAWVRRRRLVSHREAVLAPALVRGAMEAVTWLARNRRTDRTAQHLDETGSRDAAIRLFVGAFEWPPEQ